MRVVEKVTGKVKQIQESAFVKRLENVTIYDTKNLSYDIQELRTVEVLKPNDFYGNAFTLKKFSGINLDNSIKASLEHATYFGENLYWDLEVNHEMPGIITQGNIRKEVLRQYTDKKVYVVGPYMFYADSFFPKERMELEKQKSGKTLTVFPMHSTTWIDIDYNVDLFIEEIERVKSRFDTVRICMYWKDIIRGTYEKYKEKGYEIVCAGHIYDKYFLPRLKSIIELSDCIMSNDVGSYVGQAVVMNKPVYLFRQSYECSESENASSEEYIERLKDSNYEKVFKAFNEMRDDISEEQYQICDYFWGVRSILSKAQMRDLLLGLERDFYAEEHK